MSSTPIAVWHAFAKINRDLRVFAERPDGYHSVETVIQTIELADEIRIYPSRAFHFTSSGSPQNESNLVVRAVRAFEEASGIKVSLHIDLAKRVPVGRGLGGGSSDAAVTLMGLDRHFGVGLPGEDMQRLMAALGSDVPFFWVGGRVLGVGRGEQLFPLPDAPDSWLVLVCPRLEVSTAEAYSWLTQTTESTKILSFCARFLPELSGGESEGGDRANDFEEPLFRRFPELAEIKRVLLASGARLAAVSGSGSAVFGEFETESAAGRAAALLREDDVREDDVRIVRPLRRSEYARRMFQSSEPRAR